MARHESFQGSLALLVLKVLARRGPLHGYGITQRIHQVSKDLLRVEEGSLYPALHRMEEHGWIKAKWSTTDSGRRVRIYDITADGRTHVAEEEKRWKTVNEAVLHALKHA